MRKRELWNEVIDLEKSSHGSIDPETIGHDRSQNEAVEPERAGHDITKPRLCFQYTRSYKKVLDQESKACSLLQ